MDGGAWRATVDGVAKGQMRLSDCTFALMALRRRVSTRILLGPPALPHTAAVHSMVSRNLFLHSMHIPRMTMLL